MDLLRAYAHLFTRHRRAYVLGILLLLVTNAVGLAIPRVLGLAVDAVGHGASVSDLLAYAGAIAALAVVQAAVRVGSRVQLLGISRRVAYELKGMLHDRLLRLAPSFYTAANTGDLMSRMTHDVMLVRALAGPGVLYLVNAVLVYLIALAYMLSLEWRLTLLLFLPLPPMAWLVRGLVHRVRHYVRAAREALGALNTVVQENLAGVHVVKSFALEEAQVARFDELSRAYMGWGLRESWARAQMIPLVGLAAGLASVLVLGVGGEMVAAGRLSLGDLVAFLGYIGLLIFPTVALGWILSLVQRGLAALERLHQVLSAPVTVRDPDRPRPLDPPAGSVCVRGLSFRYDDAVRRYAAFTRPSGDGRRPALLEVELEVAPGGFVALVGRVGSGKSTLLKAILRLVEVPPGTVWVDGRDVTTVAVAELRRRIGYVPQDDFLFSATLYENVAFGRPDASEHEVWEAVRAAGLEADVAAMPEGLMTPVGERGLTLSGGQRQRVALARALLLGTPILLLDNALSYVDAETERHILDRLGAAAGRRTLIVASNRLAAVQRADQIVVLEGGRVVARGTHEELIARPGPYAAMYERQRLAAELERL